MRFLVVGAGAIGGYFGGRLLEAGRDVTFLLRPARAAQIAVGGLAIRSALGDADLPAPPWLLAEDLAAPFDVVLLSCKAQDLAGAVAAFAPAVGPGTAILPLLNGMRHLDALDARFGPGRVLGGECLISTTLDEAGRVIHLNEAHSLLFGERDGASSARTDAIAEAFAGAQFDGRRSDAILQEMWEKWVFIAAAAGITCLLRATVGDIVAAGASEPATALLAECGAIAAAQGFAPRDRALDRFRRMLAEPGSTLAASMLRDIERGAATEGEHILGDLLRRAAPGQDAPMLRLAQAHLRAYEARRTRERGAAEQAGSEQGAA
jgi:2-dehydropantoate 2-reductase